MQQSCVVLDVTVCAPIAPVASATDDLVMARIAAYIAGRYASRIRMVDLASHANVSVRTLQNLFHQHCGEPPLKALRRYRLHKLHAAMQHRPWVSLRVQFDRCGLTGAIADRDLFLAMYGITIREHQHACRHSSVFEPAQAQPWSRLDLYLPQRA
jgi:AraC-like DNA-binding protein